MIWLYACGGPQEGAGAGSECFRDADCVEGLICVEHACSNDVDGLVSTVEGPSGEEAAATEGTATSTSTSTGGPETSAASTDSTSTSSGSTTTTGSTSGSGGTGATTTQGAAGAAGSP